MILLGSCVYADRYGTAVQLVGCDQALNPRRVSVSIYIRTVIETSDCDLTGLLVNTEYVVYI